MMWPAGAAPINQQHVSRTGSAAAAAAGPLAKLVLPLTAALRLPAHSALPPPPPHTRWAQVFLTSSHLVLSMEYAAGGDLFRYVAARRGLPEEEARWFFQQIIIAIDYCHRMVRGGSKAGEQREGGCGQGQPAPACPLQALVATPKAPRLLTCACRAAAAAPTAHCRA